MTDPRQDFQYYYSTPKRLLEALGAAEWDAAPQPSEDGRGGTVSNANGSCSTGRSQQKAAGQGGTIEVQEPKNPRDREGGGECAASSPSDKRVLMFERWELAVH